MFEVIWNAEPTANRRRLYGKLIDSTDATSGKNIAVLGVKAKLTKADGTAFTSTADIVLTNSANAPGRFYVELTAGEADTVGVIDGEVPAGAGYLAATLHGEIVGYDPYTDGASVSTIAEGVRTELAPELADVLAIKAKTDNLPPDPADASDIAGSFGTVNTTLGTIASYVDTEVASIKSTVEGTAAAIAAGLALTAVERKAIADALLARNQKGGADGPPEESVSAALAGGFFLFSGADTATITINNGDGTPAFTRTLSRDLTKLLGAIIAATA